MKKDKEGMVRFLLAKFLEVNTVESNLNRIERKFSPVKNESRANMKHYKQQRRISTWAILGLASLLTSVPALAQFSVTSSGGITITDQANATPFPSPIVVSNVLGTIERVTVTFNGVTHTHPDDIDAWLQAPAGPHVILMSDAGGQFDLAGASLTFADAAASGLPDESQISSGTYRPTDFEPGDIAGGSTTLSTFAGQNPNGTWSLRVRDDQFGDAGSIASWTLTLFTTPTVTLSTNTVSTPEDTSTSVGITVRDTDTPADNLTVTAVVPNNAETNIVHNSGLSVTGTGENRTLTITPRPNAVGTVTVEVRVNDGIATVTTNLTVNVTAVNDAPTLTLATNRVETRAGVMTTNIPVTVNDVDTAASSLTLSATSDNPAVVDASGVVFGGSGNNRTVAVSPTGSATGTANLTIRVTDGGQTNSAVLTVVVNPVSHVIGANSTRIVINDNTTATPYPSTISLGDVSGLIGDLTVTLADVTHPNPEDIGVLLVGPAGQKVVLMRAAGNANAVTDARITFASSGTPIPDSGPITTGTYTAADYSAGGNFPGSAPAGPYSSGLSALAGTNPDGNWSLYVYDSAAGGAGEINGGWVLNIFPAPVVGNIPNQTTAEDTPITVTFPVSDFDGTVTNVTATSGNPALVAVTSTSVSGTTGSVTLTPQPNQFGATTITVVAQDNSGFTGTNTFTLTVTSQNDLPTLSSIAKTNTPAGVPVGPIPFTVGDVETAPGNIVVTAASDNETILPAGNIVLGGSGADRTITLFPAGTVASTRDINVTVTATDADGGVFSRSFPLVVTEPANPLYENRATIIINDNSTASPYPSTIDVSGLVGQVSDIAVTLFRIGHPAPDDIDVMLVGPTGTRIILMSDAGDANALNNTSLVFRDSAPTPLPDSAQITSGFYRPTDFEPGDVFPAPAPTTGTLTPTFAGFDNTSPNGQWRLFVVDDSAAIRGGVIEGGWQLSIRTAPDIVPEPLPDVVTEEDVARRVTITIGDPQPGVNFAITVTSSAPAGQPDVVGPIDISRSGGTVTLNITPESNVSGTNIITLTVSDPETGTSDSADFNFIVTPVNDAPTISNIPDQSTPAATATGPIPFTVGDPETAPGSLTVTASSSNTALVPNSNITLGGSGANRTIDILPAGIETGQTTITVTVSDGSRSTSDTFVLTVPETSRNVTFANSGRITINDDSPATPYPSAIDVSGVSGSISGVRVILVGLSHPFPDDIDILLVAPGNRPVMLMSDAGGGGPGESISPSSPVRLEFRADAGSPIPDETAITSGTYRPANYLSEGGEETGATFALSAPLNDDTSFGSDLTTLEGINPNGQWRLYVRDDQFPDGGLIEGGWIVILETGPTISDPGNQTTAEDTPLVVPFTVLDQDTVATNLALTFNINDAAAPGLLVPANLTFDTNTASSSRTLTIIPSTNRPPSTTPETNTVTVTVTDNTGESDSTTFQVRVTPVNDPPTLTTSTNRVITNEDIPITIPFTIGDIDSVVGRSNVVVTSSNTALVPNANIGISGDNGVPPGSTGNVNVTVTNAPNQSGSTVLTVTLTDRNTTVTNLVTVEVTPVNDPPTISAIDNKSVVAGTSTTNISFTVGDAETPTRNLTVTATSSDQTLVPNGNIVLGGTDANRTVQVTTIGNQPGTATITLTVRDENNATAVETFDVTLTAAPGTVFANTTAITIRDNNTAQPYPSTINVSGLNGAVHRILVTLDGFTHSLPDDVDILLVGPTGRKVVLMSDAGNAVAASNLRLTFNDAGRILPDESALVSETYAPANYGGSDTFPAPAPAGPISGTLAEAFNGTNPNGAWSLYVVDDTASNSGQIAFGWSIRVETAPTIVVTDPAGGAAETWPEDGQGSIAFTIGDEVTAPAGLELTFSSSNPTLLPEGNIVLDRSGGANVTATLRSAANQSGTNVLTITVRRPSDGAQSSAVITNIVTPVNDPSTISRLVDRFTTEDDPITFEVEFNDVDDPLSKLWIEGTSSNQAVISSTNILFLGRTNLVKGLSAPRVSVTLVPNQDAIGSSTITFGVSVEGAAGTLVTSNFVFTVTEDNDPPTITSIPNKTFQAGTTSTNIPFTVTDPEGANITVTATSSDQAVVRDAGIVIDVPSGPSGTRNVRITTENIGTNAASTVITLRATDAGGLSTNTQFTVNVRPSRDVTFTSTDGPIIIPITVGPATPYPSVVNVSGLNGNISKVVVSLNDFTHRFPDDVDMLLVSPTGQKITLMSDAGGGSSVTNRDLRFDQAAADPVPDSSLPSGTYQPANYAGEPDIFPAPAPVPPYGTSLNAFNGASPNGQWQLFVTDDVAPDGGSIQNWSLTITTVPVIMDLADLTTEEDVPARGTFTIAEESFASTDFTFTASSTNTALVNATNVVITGTGTNRTVTVTPNPNASGETEITLTLTNPDGQTVSDKFKVFVTPVNDTPLITDVADQTIPAGGASPAIPFDYSDVETPRQDLIVTIASSNPAVIPVENVQITGNELRIFAEGGQTGQSDITITVSEPGTGGLSASTTFLVTVTPVLNPQFANGDGVIINDFPLLSVPYPSTIDVSRVVGTVTKVTVTLQDLSHNFPDDLDILLVGPAGQKVVLMSDAGSGGVAGRLQHANITFDDAAAQALPDSSAITPFGTYRPSNYEGNETFTPPAPAGPYSSALSAFNATDPNGTWSLYIVDDAPPDAGTLGGWVLNIFTTAPMISDIPDVTIPEEGSTNVTFQVGDGDTDPTNLVVTATTDADPVVSLTLSGTGATRTLAINALPNATGTDTITVSVSDGTETNTTGFLVTVTPVNDAPTISGLSDTNTPSNVRLRLNFTVSDVDTDPTNVTTTATSNVGTVSVEGTGSERTLTFDAGGSGPTNATVSVVASDGQLSTTNTFNIAVTQPTGPQLAPIPPQTTPEDVPLSLTLNVTDANTPLANLQFSHTASNPALVRGVTFTVSGNDVIATVSVATNLSGTSDVTITVSDGTESDSETFTLTVSPSDDPPVLAPIPNQAAAPNSSVTVNLDISDVDTPFSQLIIDGASSDPAVVTGVTINRTPFSATATINTGSASGTARVTITVRDSNNTVSQSFDVAVGRPPVLAPIADQTTTTNRSVTVPLEISDQDTPFSQLTITGTSSNPAVVSSVTINRTPFQATATLNVVNNATGTSDITITVSDGSSTVSDTFTLTVRIPGAPPVLAPIADQTTAVNTSPTVPLNISDTDTPFSQLTITGTSANPAVVSSVTINRTAFQATATLNVVNNATGTADITITVSDPDNTVSDTFTLTVSAQPQEATLAIAASGGNVVISVTGTVGATYTIEGTTDFVTWTTAGTVTIDADGTSQLTIPATGPHRFFRARAGGASGPTITNAVETGGDNEATDTVTAKWTGVTFTNGVANEPVRNTAATAPYTVGPFGEDAPSYVDRDHQWNGATTNLALPAYLMGGDYIMIGNDNRDNAAYKLDVTVSTPARVYLLIDNRLNDLDGSNPPESTNTFGQWVTMTWVSTAGFQPMMTGHNRSGNNAIPDEIGIDEGGNGTGPGGDIQNYHSIYMRQVPAGTFSLLQGDNPGRNMYGVVIVPSGG